MLARLQGDPTGTTLNNASTKKFQKKSIWRGTITSNYSTFYKLTGFINVKAFLEKDDSEEVEEKEATHMQKVSFSYRWWV